MSNTRKIASVAFTGAAVAGVAGFAAAPAFAAGTYHVNNGGAAYHGSIKATASDTVLTDTTHAATLHCSVASTAGSIPNASPPGPGKVASISVANFRNCTLLGVTFQAHLNQSTSLFGDQPTTASGVTKGHIGNVVSAGLSGACTATITGTSVPGSYNNANHSLNVNPGHAATLTINNPVNCPVIQNGDKAFFAGHYHVTTPAALTVSGG